MTKKMLKGEEVPKGLTEQGSGQCFKHLSNGETGIGTLLALKLTFQM